jgi:hypothetical protein
VANLSSQGCNDEDGHQDYLTTEGGQNITSTRESNIFIEATIVFETYMGGRNRNVRISRTTPSRDTSAADRST